MANEQQDHNDRHEQSRRLQQIEIRLAAVEEIQSQVRGLRRFLYGVGAVMAAQILGGAISYGELKSQLNDVQGFRKDTSTVLGVLGDHGTELVEARRECSRLQGRMDKAMDNLSEVHKEVKERTTDRYRRKDAEKDMLRMQEWVEWKIQAIIAKQHRGP